MPGDANTDEGEHGPGVGRRERVEPDETQAEPGAEPGGPGESGAAETMREATPLTQQIGRIAVAVIAVLFGIFAVANSQFVSFDWIFGQTQAEFTDGGEHLRGGVPLIVLLIGSFVLGAIVAWIMAWWSGRGASGSPQAG